MIYTCDNCHYTFASDEKVYICPECKVSSIGHKFGTINISISTLRQATEEERDIYKTQMGIKVKIPAVTSDNFLTLFRNLESSGIVFAKIGKSDECDYVKGEKYPYKTGLTSYKPTNTFTFEPMNIVYNYIHYGDNLVVLSFTKMWELHRSETMDILAISENDGNEGCFQANMLYTTEIVPLNSERAIDLIVPHLSEKDVDSILARFYEKEYYETTRYLEKMLRKRFPSFTKQHTLSGDVEYNCGHVFRRKKLDRKMIEIDYVTYRLLHSDFSGNSMPTNFDPIKIGNMSYINVVLD